MVTVTDIRGCVSALGKAFCALVINGDITFVRSAQTNNFYATSFKALLGTTFTKEVCQGLIGKTLPGEIQRVECDPYEFTVRETGETIMVSHKYRYNPDPVRNTMEEAVFTPEPISVHA
jgi:hypothetical protein